MNTELLIFFPTFLAFKDGKGVFLHTLFLENEQQINEKNTGQCLLTKTKLTCKNLDKSEKKKKRPKIRHRSVMLSALQLVATFEMATFLNRDNIFGHL